MAYGIPVAALDLSRITAPLEVRYATGHESYLTFAGHEEHPDPGEVVFADAAGRAHARRWTNRQSGHSAVREGTSAVLVVAEAMHAAAPTDVPALLASLAGAVRDCWAVTAETSVLSQESPSFR
jgi:DNA/RNA-binding domain of Phe-tRNA-synthetase-like protein